MRAVVVAALVVATACGPGPRAPGAVSAPAMTEFVIPTRSPAPSVSPTRFAGSYGFLVSTGAGYALRREGDATPIATLELANLAASPDGRLVAGWSRTTPSELRVVDVARPGTAMPVVALPADERGLSVAWSVEGSGLVYSVSPADLGSRGLPAWSAVRTVDIASRVAREITRVDGAALRPVVWDRLGGDLVAAFVVRGDIAQEYVLVRGVQAPQRKSLPDKLWHVAVSGDERWIVLAAENEPMFRTFQADDPSFVVETHGLTDARVTAVGRPLSGEIGVVLDAQLVLWDPASGQRRLVPTAEKVLTLVAFRFDGSAAVVRTSSGLQLLEIASGKLQALDAEPSVGVALP